MSIFIIEHLEPELYPWCLIEYKNISRIVGKNNVWFTNIKPADIKKLSKYGKVFNKSIKHLINKTQKNCCPDVKKVSELITSKNSICILDPEAKKTLISGEKFKFFIFGGILGDNPPRKRTQPELSIFFPEAEKRSIGKEQFSTDNAVYVVKEIVEKGKKLDDLKFQQGIEIKTGKYDSIILPYLYPLINNKPAISKELIKYIKKHQGF